MIVGPLRPVRRGPLLILAMLGALMAPGARAWAQAVPAAEAAPDAPPTAASAESLPTAPAVEAVEPEAHEPVTLEPGTAIAPSSVTLQGPVMNAPLPAQGADPAPPAATEKKAAWYEKINLRGYTQFRYNRLPSLNQNDDLVNKQGDRSIGRGNGFTIRRARLILFGDVHERVSIYLQPDFASTIDDQLHVTILRDWYADIFLDKAKEFRFRLGQSKVPYGFENMQSSQNRLPLDRNDALNSAVKDERDIGVFFYWAPSEIRARFKYLVESGLKGSGDYGVVGMGVYNGQTANRPAVNDDMHVVGRLTWPFKFGEQFVEIGGGGYYGKYDTKVDDSGTYTLNKGKLVDARAHATLVIYPQPFGFAAEGTYGVGPSLGEGAEANEVDSRKLIGGYAQVMFKIDDVLGTVSLIPFARATYYDGGRKFETNAPNYEIKELELGLEWQLIKNLELVTAYDLASRSMQGREETGHVTRVQVQVNY